MRLPMLRVLLITHGLPPESVGGVEQHVHGLARALIAAGHEVTIFARSSRDGEPGTLHDEEFDFGNKGEKLLKRYLGSLADGASHQEAVDAHFKDKFALDVLEPKFRHYLTRWKDPDRTR